MSTMELPALEVDTDHRSQEISRSLMRLDRRDWSLWGSALVIILGLSAAVLSLAESVLSTAGEPFFRFHISQSVHALVGLVMLFNVYAIYQQIQIKRVRGQLAQQMERAEEFLKLAMLDPLTSLHNRRFAQERLAAEIARAQRHKSFLTVLMFDLDNFKQLNDRYGHLTGDSALRTFSERLSKAIRGYDLAVRMGGDEFLVLLPECTFAQVQHVLARMRPLEVDANGGRVSFTFSAGWADYQPGESPEQLLRRADDALYADKQRRRNSLHPVL